MSGISGTRCCQPVPDPPVPAATASCAATGWLCPQLSHGSGVSLARWGGFYYQIAVNQVLLLFLVLEGIDPNKVYVLGGLVDESIHKVGSSLLEPKGATDGDVPLVAPVLQLPWFGTSPLYHRLLFLWWCLDRHRAEWGRSSLGEMSPRTVFSFVAACTQNNACALHVCAHCAPCSCFPCRS